MANAVPSLAGPTKMLAKDDATAMRQPSSAPASSTGISQHQDEPAGLSEVTIAMDISEGLSDVLAEGAATTASSSFADSDIADEPSEIQHVLVCLIVVMTTGLAFFMRMPWFIHAVLCFQKSGVSL
ncbi:uncharacterized protein LOC125942790 [Dermacentor silvarum]|uniref:uncharacterized protein LOC125942790 n=1 Tax=Dermacentor silvarum TaxID=543639 RepID=UPI002100F2FB|nr:uncharacterized protein LOC125942790 [Dermacentor silvarum]